MKQLNLSLALLFATCMGVGCSSPDLRGEYASSLAEARALIDEGELTQANDRLNLLIADIRTQGDEAYTAQALFARTQLLDLHFAADVQSGFLREPQPRRLDRESRAEGGASPRAHLIAASYFGWWALENRERLAGLELQAEDGTVLAPPRCERFTEPGFVVNYCDLVLAAQLYEMGFPRRAKERLVLVDFLPEGAAEKVRPFELRDSDADRLMLAALAHYGVPSRAQQRLLALAHELELDRLRGTDREPVLAYRLGCWVALGPLSSPNEVGLQEHLGPLCDEPWMDEFRRDFMQWCSEGIGEGEFSSDANTTFSLDYPACRQTGVPAIEYRYRTQVE
jgi:hypothetical protein